MSILDSLTPYRDWSYLKTQRITMKLDTSYPYYFRRAPCCCFNRKCPKSRCVKFNYLEEVLFDLWKKRWVITRLFFIIDNENSRYFLIYLYELISSKEDYLPRVMVARSSLKLINLSFVKYSFLTNLKTIAKPILVLFKRISISNVTQ